MTEFYDRRVEILLDGQVFITREPLEGRQFKITFEVLHDFGGFTSYADMAVYNLSTDTANLMLKKGRLIELDAGYVNTVASIFQGNIINVLRERDGANTITRILARGEAQPGSKNANVTLGKDAKVLDVLKSTVSAMGLAIDIKDSDFSNLPPVIYGYSLSGDPRVILDKLAVAFGFSYAIEGQKVVIVKDGGTRNNSNVIEISQFKGMEGIPEISEVGADVSSRLNPQIRIGDVVNIQSELRTFSYGDAYYQDIPEAAGTGNYSVLKVRHSGDTKGSGNGSWTTHVTGLDTST